MPVIKIEGLDHRQGIAKSTGKPYDFFEIHYLGEDGADRRVNGRAAKTKTVDVEFIDEKTFIPGQFYEVHTDLDGNVDKPIVHAKP